VCWIEFKLFHQPGILRKNQAHRVKIRRSRNELDEVHSIELRGEVCRHSDLDVDPGEVYECGRLVGFYLTNDKVPVPIYLYLNKLREGTPKLRVLTRSRNHRFRALVKLRCPGYDIIACGGNSARPQIPFDLFNSDRSRCNVILDGVFTLHY